MTYSQGILEALQLKNKLISEYVPGEHVATDTIIDLENAYYEEYLSQGNNQKRVIRQATLFPNHDSTVTLGISTMEYDFVCSYDMIEFYELSVTNDSLYLISNEYILPEITIRDLVTDSILSILNNYLPLLQQSYLTADDTIEKLLSEVYHICYLLPHTDSIIIATLNVCDYIPTNEISISQEDWTIIESDIQSIELRYDHVDKKLKRIP